MTTPHVRAWQYRAGGYPSCLQLNKIPSPAVPSSPRHIIISTKAAAINPVDIQIMNLPFWAGYVGLPVPSANDARGLGEDFAGVVVAAGSQSGYKAGDHVFGISIDMTGASGKLQEVSSIDCSSSAICKKPDGWSWAQAASLPLVWLTARTCIDAVMPTMDSKKSNSTKPKLVVLGGSSATGMYMVHMAAQRGWSVLATCSGRNVEFVKTMGADNVVDYTQQSVLEEVHRWAPDAIIDCVGGTECLNLAPRYVTIVGDKTSRLSMGGAATYMWQPQMWLRWALGRVGLGVWYDCVNLELRNDWLEETLQLEEDKIVIDSTFELSDVEKAFEKLNTGRARGKVVVTMPS